jgi:hypothetical protein
MASVIGEGKNRREKYQVHAVVGIRSREKSICGGKGSYMYDAKILEHVAKQSPVYLELISLEI